MKHTQDSVERILQGEWSEITRKEISRGIQFRLPEGTTVNFYPGTSKVMVQGRDCEEKKRAEHLLNIASAAPLGASKIGTVFAAPEKFLLSTVTIRMRASN